MRTKLKSKFLLTMVIMLVVSVSALSAASYSWSIGEFGTASLSISGRNNSGASVSNPHYGYHTSVQNWTYAGSRLLDTRSNAGIDHSYVAYINGNSTRIDGRFSANGLYKLEGLKR